MIFSRSVEERRDGSLPARLRPVPEGTSATPRRARSNLATHAPSLIHGESGRQLEMLHSVGGLKSSNFETVKPFDPSGGWHAAREWSVHLPRKSTIFGVGVTPFPADQAVAEFDHAVE